jgi:hypothetical protein
MRHVEIQELETTPLQCKLTYSSELKRIRWGSGTLRKSHFGRFASALPDMASKYCNAANARFSKPAMQDRADKCTAANNIAIRSPHQLRVAEPSSRQIGSANATIPSTRKQRGHK